MALDEALRRVSVGHKSREGEFWRIKDDTLAAAQQVQPHIDHPRAIRDVLPHDGFLVEEICQAGFTSYFGFPVYRPRTFVSCGHQGTLGFGFPTALGVRSAIPTRQWYR
jgi:acetolactate synthase-1/2/3 large subunit